MRLVIEASVPTQVAAVSQTADGEAGDASAEGLRGRCDHDSAHLQVINRDRHDGGRVISIVSPGTNKPTFSSAMTARIAVYPYTCRRCSTYHAIAIIRGAAHRNEPEPATDPECLRSVRLESTFRNPFIIVEAR